MSKIAIRRRPFVIACLTLAVGVLADVSGTRAQTATPPTGTFSVSSFETDLFTGTSNAQIPIVVPPGAAGVAPQVLLRYSSGTVDDISARTQGQSAGLGWTLDIGGYIVRDTKGTVATSDDTFKLVYGGTTYDLVKVDSTNNYYHTKNEIFVRLQYNTSGDYWTLQTKDGVQHRYGFSTASKGIALNVDLATNVTYKYLLDQVTTASGVAIQYAYTKVTAIAQGTTRSYDQAIYPDRITYAYSGGSIIGGETRQVQFFWTGRQDYTDTHVTTRMSFHEAQRLDHIDVTVGGALVRKYVLGFDYSIDRDTTYTWGGGATGDLTLRTVTIYGSDGVSALPGLSFSYTNSRLSSATNGIGGTVSFAYEEIKSVALVSTACKRTDELGACVDYGPALDTTGTSSIGAYIFQTSGAGTQPLYSACIIASSDGTVCVNYGVASAPDAYGFSTLIGYALTTNLQGTVPLYSVCTAPVTDENGNLMGCGDWNVGTAPDGYFSDLLVGYAYVAKFDRYRVTSRTTNDGRGVSSTMTFSYTSPGYSADGKEFRGHASVRAVDPAGNYTDTVFDQDDVFKGRPVTSQTNSGSGNELVYVSNGWTSTSPYTGATFVRLDSTTIVTCPDGVGTCRQTRQNFFYDANGNPIHTQYLGDTSVSGDERDEYIDWVSDTAHWIFRTKRTYVTDVSGAVARERCLSYDGLAWGSIGSRGLVTREEARLAAACGQNAAGNPTITYAYDSYGNRTSTTDPRSCTTTTAYDGSQTYPATVTTCLGFQTQFSYDHRFGVTTSLTDPNGQLTSYSYDALGRQTKVTGPLDTSSTYGTVSTFYLDFGNPSLQRIQTYRTQRHGFGDVVWTSDYFDGLGRVYQTQNQGPGTEVIVADRTYDNRGLVSAFSAPHFVTESSVSTTYLYDAIGRETRVNNPDGTFHTTSYTPSMVTITDERGTVRKRYLDAYNRLTRVDEVNGGQTYTTTYQYDAVGSLTRIQNHLGNVTTIGYDLLGRKTSMQDPNMGFWTYGYDLGGNLTSQTDAKNQTLTFGYDPQGRVQTKQYPGGAQIAWTYDDPTVQFSKGRLTRVVDLAADTRFGYDALGEVVQTTRIIDGVTYTMSQTYDALGQVTTRTFPDGETVTYSYNSAGWLAAVTGYVDAIGYNARGQRVNVWYSNGAVSSFVYHPQNFRMTNRTTTAASVTVQNLSFVYDAGGNINQITDGTTFGSASRTFSYDPLNRLTSASGTFGPLSGGLPTSVTYTYVYNAIGDILTSEGLTYAYSDPLHASAVTSLAPGGAYTYDNNGNMITAPGGRSSSWDADNRLIATTIQGGNSATFGYDHAGQRVKKTTNLGTTYYPFPDYEVDPAGVTSKYVRFKDEIMAAKKSTGARLFYHAEQLGSVHVMTDITGTRAQLVEYSPWGRVVRSEGTAGPTKGFNGKDLDDPEIGLLYYTGRYYIAGIGRFMSPDPIVPVPGNPQALNRYSYVLNNPITLTDPSGFSFFGDLWKSITKWARKNELVSIVIGIHLLALPSPVANLAGFAMLYATETGRYTLAATIVVGTAVATFYCGGCGVAAGALIGEAIGGFSAYQNGGNVLLGVIVGGAAGAVTGYLSGLVPSPMQGAPIDSNFGLAFARGSISGTGVGVASGFAGGRGSLQSIVLTVAVSSATAGLLRGAYTAYVGYDATFEPGGDAVRKPFGSGPIQGANNFGSEVRLNGEALGGCAEGGACSRFFNSIPMMNAIAGAHDTWMTQVEGWGLTGGSVYQAVNWSTMLPAGALTLGTLVGSPATIR